MTVIIERMVSADIFACISNGIQNEWWENEWRAKAMHTRTSTYKWQEINIQRNKNVMYKPLSRGNSCDKNHATDKDNFKSMLFKHTHTHNITIVTESSGNLMENINSSSSSTTRKKTT